MFCFLAGASERERADAEKARKKLAKEDVAFTPEMFLKKVFSGDEDIVQLFLEAGMPGGHGATTRGGRRFTAAAQGDSEKTLAVILEGEAALEREDEVGRHARCAARAASGARKTSL